MVFCNRSLRARILMIFAAAFLSLRRPSAQPPDIAAYVPQRAPRTTILAGNREGFRQYCLKGEGAKGFAKIKTDFDELYAKTRFPAEPLTYGDPNPKARDSDKADKWRDAQDTCGLVSGIAEAATLLWNVTGEEKYLLKAKEFL